MHTKWYKYILSLIIIFFIHTNNILHNVSAQQSEQIKEIPGSELDDLKWQLKQMEAAVLRQQEQMKQMEELTLRQQEQIQALKSHLDKISTTTPPAATQQEQLEVLKNRIDAVGTETAQIAKEEAKHAVEDYLSNDETREKMGLSLPSANKYTPVDGYYFPDKEKASIGFKTSDEKYSLYVGFRMQTRFTYRDNDEDLGETDKTDIDVRRARLCFGGNIYSKDVNYYVELDGDSFEVNLRDYYVYWTPSTDLMAKIGYFKVPANRQWISSGFKLLFQDRSIASDAFKQDRDYGLDIFGLPFDKHLEYHAAVFRGVGQNPAKAIGKDENIDNELLYVLTARYYPFGDYKSYSIVGGWDETDEKYEEKFNAVIGASVVYNAKERDTKPVDTDTIIGNIELGMRYKGFTWDSEYYVRSKDPESDDGGDTVNSHGFYTQAGYFVLPKKLELATRYSLLDPNKDLPEDFQREYALGINYYFRGHRSKVQTDFGHFVTDGEERERNENRFKIQYQIIF